MTCARLTTESREHPALERRLLMLGVGVDRPGQRSVTFDEVASWAMEPATRQVWHESFDGPTGAAVLQRMGEAWAREAREHWAASHPSRVEDEQRMRTLESRASHTPLVAREYLELATWTRGQGDRVTARTWLSWAVHVDPSNCHAAVRLGSSLLHAGDGNGIGWLEHVAQLAPELRADGAHLIAAWHRATGDDATARSWMEHRATIEAELRGLEDTSSVALNAATISLAPPSDREQAILRHEVRAERDVTAVFVARATVPSPPMGRAPVIVLVQLEAAATEQRRTELLERLQRDLREAWFASDLDQWCVMVTSGPCPAKTLGGRIQATPTARVHGLGPMSLPHVAAA